MLGEGNARQSSAVEGNRNELIGLGIDVYSGAWQRVGRARHGNVSKRNGPDMTSDGKATISIAVELRR